MQNNPAPTCTICRVPMTPHTVKRTALPTNGRARVTTPLFRGILEDFHACPNCGAVKLAEFAYAKAAAATPKELF